MSLPTLSLNSNRPPYLSQTYSFHFEKKKKKKRKVLYFCRSQNIHKFTSCSNIDCLIYSYFYKFEQWALYDKCCGKYLPLSFLCLFAWVFECHQWIIAYLQTWSLKIRKHLAKVTVLIVWELIFSLRGYRGFTYRHYFKIHSINKVKYCLRNWQ